MQHHFLRNVLAQWDGIEILMNVNFGNFFVNYQIVKFESMVYECAGKIGSTAAYFSCKYGNCLDNQQRPVICVFCFVRMACAKHTTTGNQNNAKLHFSLPLLEEPIKT